MNVGPGIKRLLACCCCRRRRSSCCCCCCCCRCSRHGTLGNIWQTHVLLEQDLDLAVQSAGPHPSIFVWIIVFGETCFLHHTYILLPSSDLKVQVTRPSTCPENVTLLAGVIQLAISLLPTMHQLRYLNAAGTFCTGLFVSVIAVAAIRHGVLSSCLSHYEKRHSAIGMGALPAIARAAARTTSCHCTFIPAVQACEPNGFSSQGNPPIQSGDMGHRLCGTAGAGLDLKTN